MGTLVNVVKLSVDKPREEHGRFVSCEVRSLFAPVGPPLFNLWGKMCCEDGAEAMPSVISTDNQVLGHQRTLRRA